MEIKTQGIVLKTVKYGEDRLIADILTREAGRVAVALRISSSKQSKSKRSLFQPLNILDLDIVQTPRQQLATVREARLAIPYISIPFDVAKLSIAFFVAEFLHHATREAHCDPPLYDFVVQSITWLDLADEGTVNFHLMFMLRLSRFLGFMPDMESYAPHSVFDLREGRFVSTMPLHPDVLLEEDAKNLLTLMRMTPATLHVFRLSRADRNRIVDAILLFYTLHIPAFGTLKSLEVLRNP